ncbi:AAA domain-containing protein [Sphingomonas sanxanigenens]|uniref:Uncharacterized protein n=1 Tax=Sphingomonas sanxanigenens DSM 19645 = NX02 TaxID=1123269 RepID=W0AAS0_9SPHN|nr:AAA domain-containing protein [Sphingomonas sanxanigenens]AHE54201.1 hypothetical protein NX02_12515 [Sphingomonas sanxanigenens DSM 19645 = NX02]
MMNVQRDRLLDLIAYVEATERDKLKTVLDVTRHNGFLYAKDELDLPGVTLNRLVDDDAIWLHVERLAKQAPPVPDSTELRCWLRLQDDPAQAPRLMSEVAAQALINAGISLVDETAQTVRIDDYPDAEELRSALDAYIAGPWALWAEQERPRRLTIKLYNALFLLRQSLEIAVDTPIELVCGIGLATLERDGQTLRYPVLTMATEIALDPVTHAIDVRPRMEAAPAVEAETLDRMELRAVDEWRTNARRHLAELEDEPLSPFAPESYEPILRQAAALLDPDGRYQPLGDAAASGLPKAGQTLEVHETFMFFQRERRASQLMDDLARFREQAVAAAPDLQLPGALLALLTEPATAPSEEDYPSYRGISTIPGITSSDGGGEDLFFPKPFNREQVEVVQRLAVRPGVVVQGPPGTGKTHTIANIVSHYLALGKRVLVTSQKAPALKVLRDQLPSAVRPLAVSLLDSDRDGLKQFQESVEIIAGRLQRIKRSELTSEIESLDSQIDNLHRTLARIDKEVDDIGRSAIAGITLDGEQIEPLRAARDLIANPDLATWLTDLMDEKAAFAPRFSDQDIFDLRVARKALGRRLAYLGIDLPALDRLPNDDTMADAHRDLAQMESLQRQIASGEIVALADHRPETIARADALLTMARSLKTGRDALSSSEHHWTEQAITLLRRLPDDEAIGALEAKRSEVEALLEENRYFLTRPVELPADAIDDDKLIGAIADLAGGGTGLGLVAGLFAGQLKLRLASIRIVGEKPRTAADWEDIRRFAAAQQQAKRLKVAWNHAAEHSSLSPIDVDGLIGVRSMLAQLDQLVSIREHISLENRVTAEIASIAPRWSKPVQRGSEAIAALLDMLETHALRRRLERAGAIRRSMLDLFANGRAELGARIRSCLQTDLGSPSITTSDFRDRWANLRQELSEILAHCSALETVARVTRAIEESGAPNWARQLRTEPVEAVEDSLTPGDWARRWRLRQFDGWLARIDRHGRLHRLAADRVESETLLKSAYERSIELRTWLKLSNRATDKVRAALAAYAAAVRRIGRGTGKSAARYRRDARDASDRAKGALPCWIMPHYRVSESLPSDFGLFDLVIVDEASQSTLAALPALMRAEQILIVGDDKQVSPEHVGLDQDRADTLAHRHLDGQVPDYRRQLRQENSLYDLGQVVFAGGRLMLKEHFRSVAPIIEFSKAQFYAHELMPLRLPTASERLDPPLIDILVEDGYRRGKRNPPEADCIVAEIQRIANDPAMAKRTVGVTTLLGQEQAKYIYDKIQDEIGTEIIERHDIRVGDPTAFQGDERDIMFVSLVAQRGDIALSGSAYDQRFNVAASRARNRMVLVRSVDLGDLKPADKLRRALIEHFRAPFANEAAGTGSRRERCESDFEREMFDLLVARGFRVDTQVRVGNFRIDLIVEGENDRRLAIECDGDRFHGPDMWSRDMERQRLLERAGWEVWRCFASRFVRERNAVLDELLMLLETRGIEPMVVEDGWTSRHTEHRRWRSQSGDDNQQSENPDEGAADKSENALPADETPAESPDAQSRAAFPLVTDDNPDAHIFENGRRTRPQTTPRRAAVDLFDTSGDEDHHQSDALERRTTEPEIQLAILYLMTDGAEWTNGELKRVLDESFPLTTGDRMQAAHRPNERKWEELVNNALSPSRSNSLTSRALVRTVSRGHHILTDEGRALIEAKIAQEREGG